MNTKTCSMCGLSYELSIQYFCKDASHSDGYRSRCKICESESRKNKYDTNKYRESKSKYYQSHIEEHYQRSRQWKKEHPEQIKEQSKKYRDANKEKELQRHAKYREEHREEIKEKSKQYYQNNIKKCIETRHNWQTNNRTLCTIATQRYRSTKKGLISTLTKEQWDSAKEAFDNKCAYCGKVRHLEQEHFVSVSNGGTFTRENIIPSCRSCNCSKNNKDFFEWYPQYRYYSIEREEKITQYIGSMQKHQYLSAH